MAVDSLPDPPDHPNQPFPGIYLIVIGLFALTFFRPTLHKLRLLLRIDRSNTQTKDCLLELRSVRESGLRDSEHVVKLWYNSLSGTPIMGTERWTVLEQVFIASLDVGDDLLACSCLDQLKGQFKKSARVNRLFGMYLERNGKFEGARAIYTQILTEDPTNTVVRKRLIAILKAQRKALEAIDELRQYLKTFMTDFEAWNELADLYLAEGDFKHAAFCMEELLLSNPHNHLYCQRYAEIKYTEGGVENLEIARAYFSQACQLNPSNLRSLYGLILTCSALDNQICKSSLDCVTILRVKKNDEVDRASDNCRRALLNSSRQEQTPQPVITGTMSGADLNRNLVQWAIKRIRRIYEDSLLPDDADLAPITSIESCDPLPCPAQNRSSPGSEKVDCNRQLFLEGCAYQVRNRNTPVDNLSK